MTDSEPYSHVDIQRYLQHKMSVQEMRDFEKALMNDPFLADALEGFAAGDPSVAQKHLADIEASLLNDRQQARIVPLPAQKTAWWKVAAIIVVIISTAVITYSVSRHSSRPATEDYVAATTPAPVSTKNDTLRADDKPVAQVDVAHIFPPGGKRTSPVIRPQQSRIKPSIKMQGEQEAINHDTLMETLAIAAAAPAPPNGEVFSAKRIMVAVPMEQKEFRGTVADQAGNAVPFAAITATDGGVATTADTKGNFSLKASDSILDVSVNATGYAAAKTRIRANSSKNKIALKEPELSLAEVAITSLSKKKAKTAASISVDTTIAEPVGGLRNFRQYFNRQLDSLKATDDEQFFNEGVALEFSVDKQGFARNIKSPDEISKAMAEKAIDILTKGPRWNKKRDRKVKVIISF